MKNIFCVLGSLFLLTACNNKKTEIAPKITQDSLQSNSQEITEQPIATLCYLGVMDKDSVILSYEDNLGTITGRLKFISKDKGNSSGEISGLMDGDTLKVNYLTSQNENLIDKEFWFLKKDNQIKEAVGQYDDSGLYYKNYKNITFTGTVLEPADCKQVEKELAKIIPLVKKPETKEKPATTAEKEIKKPETKEDSKKSSTPEKKEKTGKGKEKPQEKKETGNKKIKTPVSKKENTTSKKENTTKHKKQASKDKK